MRVHVAAWTGGLSASRAGAASAWDLNLAELGAEETYPKGPFLVSAGASLAAAELRGSLQGPGGFSALRAPLWGGALNAGLRWPKDTSLGFFLRGSWVWLQGQGDWQGAQAAALPSGKVDLSGPSLTGQLELSF